MTRADQAKRRTSIARACAIGLTAGQIKHIFRVSHNIIRTACLEHRVPIPPLLQRANPSADPVAQPGDTP
jgi:hypothetical protein